MRTFFLALAMAAGLVAQQPNTVTANVSVTQSITTSSAVFRIQFVDANLASSVDSAATALASAGVNASHLSDVTVEISQGYLLYTYNFVLPVSGDQYTATRDKLITIQRNLSNSQTQGLGWSGSQIPSEAEVATALEQALPGLLAQAKQRAGVLAAAMAATLGPVVSLTAPSITPAGATVTVSLAATYSVQLPPTGEAGNQTSSK